MIDPIPPANIPAGKSFILPVTASSPNRRPLTFTATSSTTGITVEVHTNNPFWRLSVVQLAPSNAPGAFQTPFRGGLATVTNIGDLTFMLFRDIAPHAVDVNQGLTASGFYSTNTIFHFVAPGFKIQGGDPFTNGTGGLGFVYDDEFHPRTLFTGNGQLALSNTGKDTSGSQFFVTLGPQRALDFGNTIFGQLVRGFDVLARIAATPTNGAGRPLADVLILQASQVPDPFDTVLTLTATNLPGAFGNITIIADDGAGGRATNFFQANTFPDPVNDPPFLYPATVTNLLGPVNGRLTNVVSALDLEGNPSFWLWQLLDQNATNSVFSVIDGQLQLIVVPNTGYVGPTHVMVFASPDPSFTVWDRQFHSFAFGDTPISATARHFVEQALVPFTNHLVATFTNGVPGSLTNQFIAGINWGDNASTAADLTTSLSGQKEVRGTHKYTKPGNYPVYVTITSALGARTTVVSTAVVPPALSLTRSGTTNVLRWPAWATDYRLQSNPILTAPIWTPVTNIPVLSGFELVVTNHTTAGSAHFRLRQ